MTDPLDRDQIEGLCPRCNETRNILSIVTDIADNQINKTTTFSCGHRLIELVLSDEVQVSARLDYEHNNSCGQILQSYKERLSGESKRPARKTITFDHYLRKKHHIVDELNENGAWIRVHEDMKDFETMHQGAAGRPGGPPDGNDAG